MSRTYCVAPAFAGAHNFLRLRSSATAADVSNVIATVPSSAFTSATFEINDTDSSADFWYMISNTCTANTRCWILRTYKNSVDGNTYPTLVLKAVKALSSQDMFCPDDGRMQCSVNGIMPPWALMAPDVDALCDARRGDHCRGLADYGSYAMSRHSTNFRVETPSGMVAFRTYKRKDSKGREFDVYDSDVTLAEMGGGHGQQLSNSLFQCKGLWVRHAINKTKVVAAHQSHGFKLTGKELSGLKLMWYASDPTIDEATAKSMVPEYFP